MKWIGPTFSLILFLHLSPDCFAQHKNDLARNDLYGRVKSMEQWIYVAGHEENATRKYDSLISHSITYFNDKSFIEEVFRFDNDQLISIEKFVYDTAFNLLESNEYNTDGSLFLHIDYHTDRFGYVDELIFDRSLQKHYNHSRNLIDVEFEKYYRDLYSRISYVNDHMGNIVEEEYFRPGGSASHKLMHDYDYRGNRVETKFYNSKGGVSWKRIFKYKRKNVPFQAKLFKSNRLAIRSDYTYEFDSKGNWVRKTEARTLEDNILTQDLKDSSILIIREFEYY
ncbi:MAG: hypothetical protein U5Q03_18995 [Bacteroidota bacterium]|nr:hypothetical protein [Bacteroidota bacterium]